MNKMPVLPQIWVCYEERSLKATVSDRSELTCFKRFLCVGNVDHVFSDK